MSVISKLLTNTTEGQCLETFTEVVMDDTEDQFVLETFAGAGRRGEKGTAEPKARNGHFTFTVAV